MEWRNLKRWDFAKFRAVVFRRGRRTLWGCCLCLQGISWRAWSLTMALMASVRRMGEWCTKLRQSNTDEECNRKSKWRNYIWLIFEWRLPLVKVHGFFFWGGWWGVKGYFWISLNQMEQHWPLYCYLIFLSFFIFFSRLGGVLRSTLVLLLLLFLRTEA